MGCLPSLGIELPACDRQTEFESFDDVQLPPSVQHKADKLGHLPTETKSTKMYSKIKIKLFSCVITLKKRRRPYEYRQLLIIWPQYNQGKQNL